MSNTGNRLYWLDNLRTFLIFLVVVIHTATVYEKYGMGNDWWIVVDPSNSDLNGILFLVLNIFVMATIFLISGYLVPSSFKDKTKGEFIWVKFKRLMIPWIVAVLTLIPLYKVIFLYSRGLPQEHWTTYFHWNSLWSQNWLWFLPILFLFDTVYILISKIKFENVSLKKSIWIALFVCFTYSYLMDFLNLHGWTKTILFDFQNERLIIYFAVFLFGAQLNKLNAFDKGEIKKKTNTIIQSLGWLPINLYIFLVIYELIYPDAFILNKVFHIALVRLMFTLSLAYLIYTIVSVFEKYFNKNSKMLSILNRSSYGVYILHVIIVGVVSVLLLNAEAHHFLKFLITLSSAYIISNVIVVFYLNTIKKWMGLSS